MNPGPATSAELMPARAKSSRSTIALRQIARLHAERLRQHHREIGGPIAERGIARPLEHGLDRVGRAERVRGTHELRAEGLGAVHRSFVGARSSTNRHRSALRRRRLRLARLRLRSTSPRTSTRSTWTRSDFDSLDFDSPAWRRRSCSRRRKPRPSPDVWRRSRRSPRCAFLP